MEEVGEEITPEIDLAIVGAAVAEAEVKHSSNSVNDFNYKNYI